MSSANRYICACHYITPEQLREQIEQQGLRTLEEVREQTKASASCGLCWEPVETLLEQINRERCATAPDAVPSIDRDV